MIVFPNAKINLGLNITAKRADGYHNISSCFLPIGWKDALEAIPSDQFGFSSSGLEIPGDPASNLCVKAFNLLKQEHNIPPVKMHLHKVIPMGAGLGGGSADGAFSLKLLNDLYELNLSTDQLEAYAKQLGADCPFFINNHPVLVSGIGEIFDKTDVDLSGKYLVVVYPDIHVSTADAFSAIKPIEPTQSVAEILNHEKNSWQAALINDFEKGVFAIHPRLQEIKNGLIAQGAFYASMSGTGSAIYGLFDEKPLPLTFRETVIWQGSF